MLEKQHTWNWVVWCRSKHVVALRAHVMQPEPRTIPSTVLRSRRWVLKRSAPKGPSPVPDSQESTVQSRSVVVKCPPRQQASCRQASNPELGTPRRIRAERGRGGCGCEWGGCRRLGRRANQPPTTLPETTRCSSRRVALDFVAGY
jgi:hypothetical protein